MPILFSDVTVVPMDGAPQVLEHAYVAVEGTKIASVGTEPPEGTFDRVVDGAGKVLLPGFVNALTHLPMTLMRGYGGGCDLHTWLHQYIFPAEARLDSRAVAAGAGLGLAEMIASGVTTTATGAATIAGAVIDYNISSSQADSKELEAILERLRQAIKMDQDLVEAEMERANDLMTQVREIVGECAETQSAILGVAPTMA